MVSHPLGDSRIGVQVNAAKNGVLLQITDSDCEQARAVLRKEDIPVLIKWLEDATSQVEQEPKP